MNLALAVSRRPLTCEECCGGVCKFRPSEIRRAREKIAIILAWGEDVSEAIGSYMAPWAGTDLGRAPEACGPTDPAEWACFVAELNRAYAAGAKTPEEVSAFLCPAGAVDDVPRKTR